MAKLTLGEAAKAASMGKTSLRRAIEAGRISAERTKTGIFLIDPSELARFMDARGAGAPPPLGRRLAHHAAPHGAPPEPQGGAPVEALGAGLEAMAQERARAIVAEREAVLLRERLDEMRAERDAWRAQAERLALPRAPEPSRITEAGGPAIHPEPTLNRPGFWRRIFG